MTSCFVEGIQVLQDPMTCDIPDIPRSSNGWQWMHSLMRAMGPLPPKIGSFEDVRFISGVIFQVVGCGLFRQGFVKTTGGSWDQPGRPRPKACFVATSYLGCGVVGGVGIGKKMGQRSVIENYKTRRFNKNEESTVVLMASQRLDSLAIY